MGNIRATFQFSNQKYSWSESHYYTTPSSVAAVRPAANALASLRAACLGQGAVLTGVRLSDDAFPRNVVTALPPEFVPTGSFPSDPTYTLWDAERPNSSLLLQFSGQTANKLMYMAGIPDATIGTNPTNTTGIVLQPQFQNALNAWIAGISSSSATSQWGFRSKVLTNPALVQAIVTNALFPGMVGITTYGPLVGIQAGSYVYLKGFRRINNKLPGLTGKWQVAGTLPTIPSGPTTYFLANTPNVQPSNMPNMGLVYTLGFAIQPYLTVTPKKAVTRKRGGSIGLPRGRSKRRV